MTREFSLREKINWLEKKNSAATPVFGLAGFSEADTFFREMSLRRSFSDYVFLKNSRGKIISVTQSQFELLTVISSLPLSTYDMSRFMKKSEQTIKNQMSSVLKHFGVHSREELVAKLVENGFLTYKPRIPENHLGPTPNNLTLPTS